MSNKIKITIILLLIACIGIGVFFWINNGKSDEDVLSNDLFSSEYIKVGTQGKFGIIDKTGKTIMSPKFDDIIVYDDSDIVAVKSEDKWGFSDLSGNILVKPEYEQVGSFGQSNLAPVMLGGKWGYVDRTGNKVVDSIYYNASSFDSAGLAIVEGDERPYYINEDGKKAFDITYDMLGSFNENGYAVVTIKEKFGVIDKKGNEVIAPTYERDFSVDSNNHAVVSLNDKYGVIDIKGNVLVPIEYDHIIPTVAMFDSAELNSTFAKAFFIINVADILKKYDVFDNNDVAIAVKNGKAGLINSKGEEVIKPQYERVQLYRKDGVVLVSDGKMYSFYDVKGNKLMNGEKYEKTNGFSNGLAAVCKNGKWGYVDKKGKFIIEPAYEYALSYADNGMAVVQKDKKFGYVNENGENVIGFKYTQADSYVGNIAKVLDDNGWKLIKSNGDIVCKNIKIEPYLYSDGYALVEGTDGKYIIYDLNGNIISKTKYDMIGQYNKSSSLCIEEQCYNEVVPETFTCEEHKMQ